MQEELRALNTFRCVWNFYDTSRGYKVFSCGTISPLGRFFFPQCSAVKSLARIVTIVISVLGWNYVPLLAAVPNCNINWKLCKSARVCKRSTGTQFVTAAMIFAVQCTFCVCNECCYLGVTFPCIVKGLRQQNKHARVTAIDWHSPGQYREGGIAQGSSSKESVKWGQARFCAELLCSILSCDIKNGSPVY